MGSSSLGFSVETDLWEETAEVGHSSAQGFEQGLSQA